jgi:hypothetical protein
MAIEESMAFMGELIMSGRAGGKHGGGGMSSSAISRLRRGTCPRTQEQIKIKIRSRIRIRRKVKPSVPPGFVLFDP